MNNGTLINNSNRNQLGKGDVICLQKVVPVFYASVTSDVTVSRNTGRKKIVTDKYTVTKTRKSSKSGLRVYLENEITGGCCVTNFEHQGSFWIFGEIE